MRPISKMNLFDDNGGNRLSRYEKLDIDSNQANRIGCVIMASGMGKRFGSNKLMADFAGSPMILHAIKKTENLFSKRVVVTRHIEIVELCHQSDLEVIYHNLPYRSDTIRLGLKALDNIDACMFLPGDQPLITSTTIENLINLWKSDKEKIVRPVFNNNPGAPVIFPKWAFTELLNLTGANGGHTVIQNHQNKLNYLSVSDSFELKDIDTVETFNEFLRYAKNKGIGV